MKTLSEMDVHDVLAQGGHEILMAVGNLLDAALMLVYRLGCLFLYGKVSR